MKIIRVKNYEEASEKAYEVMKEFIKPGAVLGLATGSTPLGLYALMVKDHEENGTDYSQIRTFNLDEYVGLPLHHRESYYSFMHTNLFNKVGIPEENTHVPGGLGDLEANCKAYDEMLAKESVDIQLLGIGADGHIGFNEPGTPFSLGTHVTDLAEQTRKDNQRFFNDLNEETPYQAVTMGPATIMAAKNVLLIATGENKAEAIKGMIEGPVSEECQASLLQNHPNCTVIIDEGAGKLLENH